MIELRLQYLGKGTFQTCSRLDFLKADEDCGTGEVFRAQLTRQRSVKQNNFFHALVEAAWLNQRGGDRFDDPRQLRNWLLVEAGHCDVERVKLEGLPKKDVTAVVGALAASIRRKSSYLGVSYDPKSHELVLRYPRSWKFKETDHDTATAVMDKVVEIITTEIVPGCEPEAIFEMAKEKAGEWISKKQKQDAK